MPSVFEGGNLNVCQTKDNLRLTASKGGDFYGKAECYLCMENHAIYKWHEGASDVDDDDLVIDPSGNISDALGRWIFVNSF